MTGATIDNNSGLGLDDPAKRRTVGLLVGGGALAGIAGHNAFLAKNAEGVLPPEASGTASQPVADPASLSDLLQRDFYLTDMLKRMESPERMKPIAFNGHTYQCVSSLHDPDTDARAFAVRETPSSDSASAPRRRSASQRIFGLKPAPQTVAKDELLLFFPGRSDEVGTQKENEVVVDMINGNQSKQTGPVADYVKTNILPYLSDHPEIKSCAVFGHSMGAPNALTCKNMLDDMAPGVKVKARLFEPLAATQAANYIARDGKDAITDEAAAGRIIDKLRHNLITINAYPHTLVADMVVGGSAVGNKPFGEEYAFLNVNNPDEPLSPSRPLHDTLKGTAAGIGTAATVIGTREGIKAVRNIWRDRVGKNEEENAPGKNDTEQKRAPHPAVWAARALVNPKVLGTAVGAYVGTGGGVLVSEALNEQFHQVSECLDVLRRYGKKYGEKVFIHITGKDLNEYLATNAEVLHPENYPATGAQKLWQNTTIGYTKIKPKVHDLWQEAEAMGHSNPATPTRT